MECLDIMINYRLEFKEHLLATHIYIVDHILFPTISLILITLITLCSIIDHFIDFCDSQMAVLLNKSGCQWSISGV